MFRKNKGDSVNNNLYKRREQIINLYKSMDFKKLDAYYRKKSFFDIIGVSRKETIHSYFLSWLLSPSESHNLNDFPIKKILEVLVLVKNKFQLANCVLEFPNEIEDMIICGNYTINDVVVERERSIPDGYLDVFISFEFVHLELRRRLNIIIENKIKSKEGERQTERYYGYGKSLIGDTIFVYLTPLPSHEFEQLVEPECQRKEFVQLNYQYLVNYVIEPCKNECTQNDSRVFIEEYLRTLSQPSLQRGISEKEKGDIIMAIGEQERLLLLSFWDTNKDLLIAALTALRDDPELDEGERESISAGLTAVIKSSNKDYTKYLFDGKTLPKGPLVREIIRKHVLNNPDITFSRLKNVFPDAIQGKAVFIGFDEAIKTKEETGYARHFINEDDKIPLSDIPIAVSNQWDTNNIASFIRVAKQLGYEIEPQNHTENIREYIRGLLDEAKLSGVSYLDINAGDVQKAVSDNKHVPSVCSAMRSLMGDNDDILKSPPKGNGTSLLIRYYLE